MHPWQFRRGFYLIFMKKIILSLTVIYFLLASCSSEQHVKKVFILSNGKFKVDESQKKITLEPSNTHTEQELTFNTADKVILSVETPSGTKTFEVPENGSYVLNLKVDTLTGGIVNYGTSGRPASMSGEQFDKMIDSTKQLIEGRNASDGNKTFFIVPFSIKKISGATVVKVVGPYKGIPYSVEADNSGKVPEVYKFFTNKQQREALNELMKRMNK